MDETTRDWVRLVGGVVFAIGMFLIFARKSSNSDWAAFPLLVVIAIPTVVLLGLGTSAVRQGDGLTGWQSAYLVTGVVLLLITLLQLADVLGANDPLSADGTRTWVFTLTALAAGYLAFTLDSRINTLLGALAIAIAGLSLVSWIGDNPGFKTFRWVLIVEAIVFAAAAWNAREDNPDHAGYLVDAAGLTAVTAGAIGYIFTSSFPLFGGHQSNFWEFFLLAVSLGLVAYSGVLRQRGPGYIGFTGLLLFAVIVGSGTTSLGGWPIILVIAGILGIGAGMAGGGAGGPPRARPATPAAAAGAPEGPPPPPPTPGAP